MTCKLQVTQGFMPFNRIMRVLSGIGRGLPHPYDDVNVPYSVKQHKPFFVPTGCWYRRESGQTHIHSEFFLPDNDTGRYIKEQ